jgi:hypothetical protein
MVMNRPVFQSGLTILASALLFSAQAQMVVTNNADSGPGSLRQTIAEAAGGDTITFDASLSGQTIALTNGQILLLKSLSIDASALAESVIINGHGQNRLFQCGSRTTNTFIGLTLTGGYTTQDGGAILNNSVLTLNACTLTGNIANEGGAVFDFGILTLNNCTVVSNYARYGGGFENDGGGPITINNSTIVGNIATNDGGGIFNFFTLILSNSTVTGNQAFYGGGINDEGTLHLNNSIVAGNTAGIPSTGQIGGSIDSSTGINITSGNPMLAPLGNYGGPTQTMPPLPGSPAIDSVGGATTSIFATDQRGRPRVVNGIVDVGAVEVQSASVFPPHITDAALLGDGTFRLSFSNLAGASFSVLASTNIALPTSNWPTIGPATETPAGSGQFRFTDPQATNYTERYYRVRSP